MQVTIQTAQGQEIINKQLCRRKSTVAPQINKIYMSNASQYLQLFFEIPIPPLPAPFDPLYSKHVVVIHRHLVNRTKPA